jgi:hypothetical protein
MYLIPEAGVVYMQMYRKPEGGGGESGGQYVYGSMRAFLYQKRPLQQNGDRRKRNERGNCMYVECSQLQGHTRPSPYSPSPIQM